MKWTNCEWISVNEKLPKKTGDYLVYYAGIKRMVKAVYNRNRGWLTDYNVTHWMPLPEPPNT